ncbi:hypothetical protein J3A83DRAFT_2913847 [Scleroderma citrinum]
MLRMRPPSLCRIRHIWGGFAFPIMTWETINLNFDRWMVVVLLVLLDSCFLWLPWFPSIYQKLLSMCTPHQVVSCVLPIETLFGVLCCWCIYQQIHVQKIHPFLWILSCSHVFRKYAWTSIEHVFGHGVPPRANLSLVPLTSPSLVRCFAIPPSPYVHVLYSLSFKTFLNSK